MSNSSLVVLETLLRGLIIGFSIAAPVGPIGVLCIRRTLSYGRWVGFISGLGAATADAIYGSIAAFGLAFLASFLAEQQVWLSLVGGLFLLFLGVRTFLARPASREAQAHGESILSAYFSTFFLTLTNPLTILSFAAIFAGLGLASQDENYRAAGMLVLGVFLGSASWWLILSSLANLFRSRMNLTTMTWVNRISGMIILLFGVAALWGVFKPVQKTISKIETGGLLAKASTEGFTRADGTYTLTFPQDFGAHPTYQTEWWYYTGNLQDSQGQHFGYQLTFFRRALAPPQEWAERASFWGTDQAYLANFAITDVQTGDHTAFERLSRGSAGLAGAENAPFRVWLDDWEIRETSPTKYQLHASVLPDQEENSTSQKIVLDLELEDLKGPILQGDQGYSQKGPEAGDASYYFSQPRLATNGTLQISEKIFLVRGTSWMDHEFSTSALSAGQVGWDWFSIQLEDASELMVFQIRRQDGAVEYDSSIDPYSSGTWIAPDGSTLHLEKNDFEIIVRDTWKSTTRSRLSGPTSQARSWLELNPPLIRSELDDRVLEAADITGLQAQTSLRSVTSVTGYGRSMAGSQGRIANR
jgi:predicted secreted hydrolase/threonine/homoserine/homoserine lactone efflux protein